MVAGNRTTSVLQAIVESCVWLNKSVSAGLHEVQAMDESIKRILVYTHNSIGLGHAFRTLAVITGIKKWRPDIDFLVISGTSIPQIFFKEGIEVIKLPSVKLDIDREDSPMHSRYLSGFDLESNLRFSSATSSWQRLIFFSPMPSSSSTT